MKDKRSYPGTKGEKDRTAMKASVTVSDVLMSGGGPYGRMIANVYLLPAGPDHRRDADR